MWISVSQCSVYIPSMMLGSCNNGCKLASVCISYVGILTHTWQSVITSSLVWKKFNCFCHPVTERKKPPWPGDLVVSPVSAVSTVPMGVTTP